MQQPTQKHSSLESASPLLRMKIIQYCGVFFRSSNSNSMGTPRGHNVCYTPHKTKMLDGANKILMILFLQTLIL